MGIRTFSPRSTPCRGLGPGLFVLMALGLGACKSAPTEPAAPRQAKKAPTQTAAPAPSQPRVVEPPAAKPAAAEPEPQKVSATATAKKAPRAGDAPTRAGKSGDLAFIERVFTPDHSADPGNLPVLVMIHGLGDRPENFLHLADSLQRPHRALSLQGLHTYGGSFGNGYAWFKTRVKAKKDKKLSAEINRAAATVAKGLKALNKKEGKPRRRFVITGFSQGGILSYALAVQYPELIATAVPVAGLLPKAARRKGKGRPKIIAFHGESDKIVPFDRGRDLGTWLKAQGYDYELQSFPEIGHRIPRPMAEPLLRTLDERLAAAQDSPGAP